MSAPRGEPGAAEKPERIAIMHWLGNLGADDVDRVIRFFCATIIGWLVFYGFY